jgi:hypothetical protein
MTGQRSGILGGALLVFIESDDRNEDRPINLFEFISSVLGATRVTLCNVEMTLSVGEFF